MTATEIVTAPAVQFTSKVSAKLIQTNATDDMVAMSAWVSTLGNHEDRLEDRDKMQGLINFLYRNKHMSPFEHGSFTFLIDCPLFVAREFHRHRTFSYNEVSGRYSELKPRFFIPASDRPLIQKGKVGAYTFEAGTEDQHNSVVNLTEESYVRAWLNYQEMLEAGIAKEVARNVLPVGLFTQFYATANPRNVMQFLTLRNDSHALAEIRDVAVQMEGHLANAMPMTYNAYLTNKGAK